MTNGIKDRPQLQYRPCYEAGPCTSDHILSEIKSIIKQITL